MLSVTQLMWRAGIDDASAIASVPERRAREHARAAAARGDKCCRAYWLAYARTLRVREMSR